MSIPKTIRKHRRKLPIEDTHSLMKLASDSSRHAIKKNFERGVSVAFIKDGKIFVTDSTNSTTVFSEPTNNKDKLKLNELLCQG